MFWLLVVPVKSSNVAMVDGEKGMMRVCVPEWGMGDFCLVSDGRRRGTCSSDPTARYTGVSAEPPWGLDKPGTRLGILKTSLG